MNNKKLGSASLAALVALLMCSCSILELSTNVEERFAMHAGDYWFVYFVMADDASRVQLPEILGEGAQFSLAVGDKDAACAGAKRDKVFCGLFRAVDKVDMSAWPGNSSGCPKTIEQKWAYCKRRVLSNELDPQLIGWYDEPDSGRGYCLQAKITVDLWDKERDKITMAVASPCEGGVTGGVVVGGPRPDVRYRLPQTQSQPSPKL